MKHDSSYSWSTDNYDPAMSWWRLISINGELVKLKFLGELPSSNLT